MLMLVEVFRAGHMSFLASLLGLERANYKVEFESLRVEEYVPVFEAVVHTPRRTKYAAEQKARRLRIGFEALRAYGAKENRHVSIIPVVITRRVIRHLDDALDALAGAPAELVMLNGKLHEALSESDAQSGEQALRRLSASVPELSEVPVFMAAQTHLSEAMRGVADVLSEMWESDRYVRSTFEEIDSE